MNAEIVTIENFLTDDECDKIIGLIDSNNVPSFVDGGTKVSVQNPDYRTSSTCMLDETDSDVLSIKQRIADFLKVDINKGQQLEGQLYEPGQFFKPHCDWFEGVSYINHALASGNRSHTFMIYLNEPEEGGETNFPELQQSIKPKKGMALVWNNLYDDGSGNRDFLHEGSEVKKGKKYIITSWWRENEFIPSEDSKLSKHYWDNYSEHQSVDEYLHSIGKSYACTNPITNLNSNISNNTFSSYDDMPRFTPTGFKVMKCPPEIWGLIKDSYELLKDKKVEEVYEGKESTILGIGNTSDILSFEYIPNIRSHIHKLLLPLHEEWSGQKLEPSFVYGIRSYNKGAVLIEHKDRVATHHISSIIIVDKDLTCSCPGGSRDWPLDIQDHNGKRHKIYAEPGDIILYESAACNHGRLEPFSGTFFRNFYVHYKLSDWQFTGIPDPL
jgi:prolyl 4-hydroxylase